MKQWAKAFGHEDETVKSRAHFDCCQRTFQNGVGNQGLSWSGLMQREPIC